MKKQATDEENIFSIHVFNKNEYLEYVSNFPNLTLKIKLIR